jgi:transposase
MSGYSLDLRERIVANRKAGKSLKWLAITFQVSMTTVKRYLQRERATGSVAATLPRYKQPQIRGEYEQQLAEQVSRLPDATLAEHVAAWAENTGMTVSTPTMCRALQRMRQTRKKDTSSM